MFLVYFRTIVQLKDILLLAICPLNYQTHTYISRGAQIFLLSVKGSDIERFKMQSKVKSENFCSTNEFILQAKFSPHYRL